MARIIVQTDDGEEVWRILEVSSWHISGLECHGNVRGSTVASGIRRAVRDAQFIQAGDDPERPSEKAMRLSSRKREER